LFGRPLLKDEVRDFLRTDTTISEPVRTLALTFLDQYADDPRRLNEASWAAIRQPKADIDRHRRAVQLAEVAHRLEPENGEYLTTLGIAQYRVGQIQPALETLTRARPINTMRLNGDYPADLAFLALCHFQQIGSIEQARTRLADLRTLMRQDRWAKDDDAQAFLREAEAIIDFDPHGP
jgi:tetratricopeptide (TPR) repeat protein